jgi:hypothetical protein
MAEKKFIGEDLLPVVENWLSGNENLHVGTSPPGR